MGNTIRTNALTMTALALLVLLWAGTQSLEGRSYYYYQNFASETAATNAGWTNIGNPYRIGRDGYFNIPNTGPLQGPDNPGFIRVNANRLQIIGRANNGQLAYNNIWAGRVAQFIPKNTTEFGTNFSASPTEPIGFLIIRDYANIDSNNDLMWDDDEYHITAINIWIAQEDTSVTNEWDNLANFVYFMEYAQMNPPNGAGNEDRSKLGWFDGSEHFPTTAYGQTNDAYTAFSGNTWRTLYDDADGGDNNAYFYGSPDNPNTQPLGIRVTHDGSKIRFYLNPNPLPSDGILDGEPNEFFLFGEVSVAWNTDMKVMFGHESLYFLPEDTTAHYGDFLVRSVCKTASATNNLHKVLAGTDNTYRLTVVPTFEANDSGIGELIIRKPSFITNDWQLSTVMVTNASDGSFGPLTRQVNSMPANNGQFGVFRTTDGDLKILFYTDSGTPGVINNGTGNKTNIVVFTLGTPETANGTGDNFQVFANLEKYRNWNWDVNNLPTTGKKQAQPMGSSALLVQTFQQPFAWAAVSSSPGVINEGGTGDAYTEAQITYEISTKNVSDRPAISQAIISVPAGFSISNVASLLINNDAVNIQVTNNFIVLNYADDAVGSLPSPNGYDRITFTTLGTPDIPDGVTNQKYQFSSTVSASRFIQGASHQSTDTNSLYPSQMITVAAEDPKLECHIFPNNLANAVKTNDLTYTVLNTGNAYNKVYKLRIFVDETVISNVSDMSSSLGGNVSYNSPYIEVNYQTAGTNLPSGQSDNISFRTVHKITNITQPETTVNFTSQSDNNNGKDYVPNTQDTLTWAVHFLPPDPKGESYVSPEEFWTSDVTNTFTVAIYNNGPKGDKVYQAKIAIPSIFTNFDNVTVNSSFIGNQANIKKTNLNGTNYIWLKYWADSTNIASRNEQIGVNPHDTVTLLLADNVLSTTNRYHFWVYVDNKTNDSFITNFSSTNLATAFATNTRYADLVYPPVFAEFDVQSRFTNTYEQPETNQFHRLDATTTTNKVVVRVKNTGEYGNFIRRVYVYLPAEVATNIVNGSISSSLITSGGVGFINKTATNDAYLLINYSAASPVTNLSAGTTDEISFQMIDHVNDNRLALFKVYARNDRESTRLTNVISGTGNSDSLELFIPPARGAGSVLPRIFFTTPEGEQTNTVVYTISNWGGGSNNITRARIVLPALFNGMILSASNTFLGADQDSSVITINSTNIVIDYTNTLKPGQSDKVYMQVRVNYNSFPLTSVTWDLLVDNDGTDYNATQVVTDKSKQQYATIRPYFNVYETGEDDHSVFTSSYSNTIRVKYVNGTNLNCQSNVRFRITVPQPFNMPYMSVENAKSAVSSVNYSGRTVTVTYSTPVDGFNYDIITMVLSDDFEEDETNTTWSAQVDYGDGYWHDVGSNRYYDTTNYTNQLAILLPPATAKAHLTPEIVFVDAVSETYNLSISNDGIPGNHIRMLEVTPPTFITNITDLVNSGPGISYQFAGGKLLVTYTNTRLLVNGMETLTFTGWDNANTSSGSPVAWTVRVANTTNTNDLANAGITAGKTLSTEIAFPSFRTEYHVTPTEVQTTTTSNQFTFYVDNKSPQTGTQDSYIQKIKIKIPQGIFITNSMQVSSLRTSDISVTNNEIFFTYTTPLAPKSNDMIILNIRDTIDYGNTNANWEVLVNYNTTGSNFTNGIVINGTNRVDLRTPNPQARMRLEVNDIYTTTTAAGIVVVLSNTGEGSNDLFKAVLQIPTGLTNNLTSYTSERASSLSYAAGQLIAEYTNFTVGLRDRITINLSNNYTSLTNFALITQVSNSSQVSNATVSGVENVLNVASPPSCRLDPKQLYTTTTLNSIKLYLNNNGSGSTSIRKARIVVPAIFTNVSLESSLVSSASISNTGNTWFITYGSAAIPQGAGDVITVTATDSIDHGATNVGWQCEVDNGNGYSPANPESVDALTNSFVMPAVASAGWLHTTWIYASANAASYVTNTVSMTVSNTGSGSNNIYRAKIVFPEILTNVSGLTSSKGASWEISNKTNLVLDYSNSLLAPGEKDTITFTLVDNVYNEMSLYYRFYADNDDGNGFVVLGTPAWPADAQQRMDIFVKEEDPSMFIAGAKATYIMETVTNAEIYTMDNRAIIRFVVKNKSKRLPIDSLSIRLTNIYNVTAITSDVARGPLTTGQYSHNTNTLIINYSGTNISTMQSETLYVTVTYDNEVLKGQIAANGSITNKMDPRIRFAGNSIYKPAQSEGRDELVLANATFGRFIGIVSPKLQGSTVTMKYGTGQTIATNTEGMSFNSSISTNNGLYVLDKIPPGVQHSLIVLPPTMQLVTNNGKVISPVSYKSLVVPGFTAIANTVINISNLILRYDRLNYQAIGEQQVYCPEDPATMLIVPPDTLFSGISVNIDIEDMSVEQETDANNSDLIRKPNDSSLLSVYHFTIRNVDDNSVLENGFKGDVELVLHYQASNVVVQDWEEPKLAIYYWKPSTKKWVMVGGLVNQEDGTLRAKVGYLHSYYAVMQIGGDDNKPIRNVKVSPNPFTPGRGDEQFSNAKLTFSFDKAYSSYEVKIYNMRGRLVRHFTRDGSYAQGEVFWDGKNKDGFSVAGGVYVYQIKAGDHVFSGTVLVLK